MHAGAEPGAASRAVPQNILNFLLFNIFNLNK